MPLHLLPKKSYNPYAPAAIARVQADEAAAATLRARLNDLERTHDAAQRTARLRGDSRPATPDELRDARDAMVDMEAGKVGPAEGSREVGRAVAERRLKEDRRKMRRLNGEDDTERDIRVAGDRLKRRGWGGGSEDEDREREGTDRKRKRRGNDAPVVDSRGHIQLFTPAASERNTDRGKGENRRGEEDSANTAADDPSQGAMRFADAAGYRQSAREKPWYYNGDDHTSDPEDREVTAGTDAFGRPDPNRATRNAARMAQADPLAVMKAAQVKLKDVREHKARREAENEAKIEALRETERNRTRDSRRRDRDTDDIGSLEGFDLDAPRQSTNYDESERKRQRRSRDHEHRRERDERREGSRKHREHEHRHRRDDYERSHARSSNHHRDSHQYD